MKSGPLTCCPFCSGALPDRALEWRLESRLIVGAGISARLSNTEARLFNSLWSAFSRAAGVSCGGLMEAMYADDPNGGPESENIVRVYVSRLRHKLKPFGLTISGGKSQTMYHLQVLQAEAA